MPNKTESKLLSFSPSELAGRLLPRILNTAAMAELPSCPFLPVPGTDLAVGVRLQADGYCAAGSKAMMCALHMTKDEFIGRALLNQSAAPYILKPIPELFGLPCPDAPPALVLTGTDMVLGAAQMLNRKALLEAAAVLGPELLILPSSVHEVLLIEKGSICMPAVLDMVRSINRSVVDPQDRLSDNVYGYDLRSGSYTMYS